MIALAAIFLSMSIIEDTKTLESLQDWFSQLNLDREQLMEIVQEMVTLYNHWEAYVDKVDVAGILKKLIAERTIQV
jgi:cyclin C